MKYRTVQLVGGGTFTQEIPETPEEVAEAEREMNDPRNEYYDGFSAARKQAEERAKKKRKPRK